MKSTLVIVIVVACALAGCTPRPRAPAVVPPEGISIAIYDDGERGYGVVDDRRWVEVTGGTLVLDRIERDAALPSVVIEAVGGTSLRVGTCTRDPSVAPVVRCQVAARRGRHLVRVLYVTTALRYRTQHALTMSTADRATVTTRFAITTPVWRTRGEVTLHDGLPGGPRTPRLLARGPLTLDGGTTVLALAPRELAARLRRIYDGAILDSGVPAANLMWRAESRRAVWMWLELTETAATQLPAGTLHAHIAIAGEPVREARVPARGRERSGELSRWPLWIDESLRGARTQIVDHADGVRMTVRLQLAVGNLGEAPRELWVEERLSPARRAEITHAWPSAPELTRRVVWYKLVLAPGATRRLGFTVNYEL
ncbi:MAG: hypothetical protein H0T89_10890 [Deltaproteobacteria bacterium]|nr:hypothetical protein [Deltaproteobacteria bacterium]